MIEHVKPTLNAHAVSHTRSANKKSYLKAGSKNEHDKINDSYLDKLLCKVLASKSGTGNANYSSWKNRKELINYKISNILTQNV